MNTCLLNISKPIKHKNAKEIRILSLKSLASDLEFKYDDSEALLKSDEEVNDDVCLELSKDDEAWRFANRKNNQKLSKISAYLKNQINLSRSSLKQIILQLNVSPHW